MYEIFERLMNERGITPYRVSKETGVSQTTLSEWKKGTYTPKIEKLQKIADYFNVALDYIMGNEQKNKSTTNSDELNLKKSKLRSIARLEGESNISIEEDNQIADYIEFLLSKKKDK